MVDLTLTNSDNATHSKAQVSGFLISRPARSIKSALSRQEASQLKALRRLIDFDRSVQAGGFAAVRYADDLIFFADSHQECLDLALEASFR
jgi:hypothetical protein